jgi:hypothetical protein
MMSRSLALLLVVGCTIPTLEEAGKVNEAGVCQVLVLPGSCADAPALEERYEAELPCNTCIVYSCDCESRTFCKVCTTVEPGNGWGCTPNAPAWCLDLEPK